MRRLPLRRARRRRHGLDVWAQRQVVHGSRWRGRDLGERTAAADGAGAGRAEGDAFRPRGLWAEPYLARGKRRAAMDRGAEPRRAGECIQPGGN